MSDARRSCHHLADIKPQGDGVAKDIFKEIAALDDTFDLSPEEAEDLPELVRDTFKALANLDKEYENENSQDVSQEAIENKSNNDSLYFYGTQGRNISYAKIPELKTNASTSSLYNFFYKLVDSTPVEEYRAFINEAKIKQRINSTDSTSQKKKSALNLSKPGVQIERRAYLLDTIMRNLNIEQSCIDKGSETWSEKEILDIIKYHLENDLTRRIIAVESQHLNIFYRNLIQTIEQSIELERLKSASDDDDTDPLAMLKKYESLLISALRVPFFVHALLPNSKQSNAGLLRYMGIASDFIMPCFEGIGGLWSFRKIKRLLEKEDTTQFKTKLLFHLIKISRLALSIMVAGGLLTIDSFLFVGVAASFYNLYKSSYILYNTLKNIQKTETQIHILSEKLKISDEKDKLYLQTQLKYHEDQLKKYKAAEYFQKRSVCRSIVLVIAAGLSLLSILFPPLGLVAFALVVAVTFHARHDLKIKNELFYLGKNEKPPSTLQAIGTSLTETGKSMVKTVSNARTSVSGFFNQSYPSKKTAEFLESAASELIAQAPYIASKPSVRS